MAAIHISEAEAARDFSGLLARVRAGAEILIEDAAAPAVLLRIAAQPVIRRLSDSLRLTRPHPSSSTLDDRFTHDLEAAIASHPEPLQNPWD